MIALSSRPVCSCDGRWVSLGDFSAGCRYTTKRSGIVIVRLSHTARVPQRWPGCQDATALLPRLPTRPAIGMGEGGSAPPQVHGAHPRGRPMVGSVGRVTLTSKTLHLCRKKCTTAGFVLLRTLGFSPPACYQLSSRGRRVSVIFLSVDNGRVTSVRVADTFPPLMWPRQGQVSGVLRQCAALPRSHSPATSCASALVPPWQ